MLAIWTSCGRRSTGVPAIDLSGKPRSCQIVPVTTGSNGSQRAPAGAQNCLLSW
jgi:hypothetical protein